MPQAPRRPRSALAAATMLNLPLGSLYAYSVFLAPMERELGLTRAELSIVFALATIAFTAGMMGAPRLFGRAPVPALVAACAAAAAGGIALAAVARGFVELALGYGLMFGLGGGVSYILVQQVVNLLQWRRPGLVNGYIVSLYPIGAMIAAPVFGWALERFGLRATLGGLAATMAVTGLATAALIARVGVAPRRPAAGVATTRDSALQRFVFWHMWLVFLLAAAAGLTVMSQAAGIIRAYGGAATVALVGTTAITGAIAAARLTGGWLIDRFPPPYVMAGAQAFALSGTVILTLWPGSILSIPALAMIGMGYGFISGSTAGAITVYWPKEAYGRVAGNLYAGWCLAAVTLPVLAGYLFDLTGGYRAAIIVAGAGNLLGILVASRLPRPSR